MITVVVVPPAGPHDPNLLCLATCPGCGLQMSISRRVHVVMDDGTLAPSLVCPFGDRGCTFHAFVRLRPWPPKGSA